MKHRPYLSSEETNSPLLGWMQCAQYCEINFWGPQFISGKSLRLMLCAANFPPGIDSSTFFVICKLKAEEPFLRKRILSLSKKRPFVQLSLQATCLDIWEQKCPLQRIWSCEEANPERAKPDLGAFWRKPTTNVTEPFSAKYESQTINKIHCNAEGGSIRFVFNFSLLSINSNFCLQLLDTLLSDCLSLVFLLTVFLYCLLECIFCRLIIAIVGLEKLASARIVM